MGSPSVRALCAVALLIAWGAPLAAASPLPIHVSVLFDFGDGTYAWSTVPIDQPEATNASWTATMAAAAAQNISVHSTWFDCCGLAVTDIAERNAPTWPALLLWNRTSHLWEGAPVGISSLVLSEGDSIAWSVAGYDPSTYDLRFPSPTPDHPFPSLGYRADLHNRGQSPSQAPNSATVFWDHATDAREIVSTPAAAAGLVFVSTLKGLLALNLTDGREMWRNPGIQGFSSPTVFDRTVLVGGADGKLHRVWASNGTEIWNTTLLANTSFSGITSSPKVLYDRLYVGTFNESGGDGEVVSLWLSDGSVEWRHATGSVHYSSPAISNGSLYVGVMGRYNTTTQITFDPPHGLLALNLTDGSERWFFPTQSSVASSAVIVGSLVVFSSKDGSVYALNTGGQLQWNATVAAGVSSPAFGQGLIFVAGGAFGGTGRVTALDVGGHERWSFAPNGPVQASPTYADGKIFFSTNAANGTVYAVNATTGAVVWAFTPQPPEYILGSPVATDGLLLAPSDNGHLYAIKDDGHPLLELSLSAPDALVAGSSAEIRISLWAIAGRATASTVELSLPAGFSIGTVNPPETSRSGGTLRWDLGAIGFAEFRNLSVAVTAEGQTANGANLVAKVTYSDNDGVPFPALSQTRASAVSPAPWIGTTGLVVGGAAAAAAVAVMFGVLWRRRGPPASP